MKRRASPPGAGFPELFFANQSDIQQAVGNNADGGPIQSEVSGQIGSALFGPVPEGLENTDNIVETESIVNGQGFIDYPTN